MKSENVFQLELSRLELLWLANILGYVQFPLLEIDSSVGDVRSELPIVQKELQERGLITYQANYGWQVEKVLVVISQLIANPDKVLVQQICNKDGTIRRIFVYPSLEFPLLIEDDGSLLITLHPEPDSLIAKQKTILKLPAKPTLAKTTFSVPNKVLPNFLNLTKSEINVRLVESGLSEKDAAELTKFLESIQAMCTQSVLQSKEGDLMITNQKSLIWNQKQIFGGLLETDISSTEFKAFDVGSAHKWLGVS